MNETRTPTEIQIQAEIWLTIWKEFPDFRRMLFHVPNESSYNNSQQASSGVIPGVPDMILAAHGRTWYIELKDDTGVISDAQKVFHAMLKKQGYVVYVFYEAPGCIEMIREILNDVINVNDWAGRVSPFSNASMYETYLDDMKRKKKERRERASKKSFTKKYK